MSTESNDHLSDRVTVTPEREVHIAPTQIEPDAAPRQAFSGHDNSSGDAKRKLGRRGVIIASVLAVGAIACAYYAWRILPYESTDNAFIEGHVTQIAPQVAGRVSEVLVRDNQFVNAGEVLVHIESSGYEAKLEQAQANLASARSRFGEASAQLTVDRAKVEQEKANLIAADAEAKRAEVDAQRYQAIGTSGVSQSQIDLSATRARSTAADTLVARNKHLAAEAQVTLGQASIETAAAEVKRSEAAVRQAELDLSYTQVKVQESGYVTRKTIEAGAYVQPGQALLAIVPRDVWVVANFKETQLTQMRPGQPVTIHVDAYPHLKLNGHIDSIQTGSGARFSLFPPENATGNYIKILQRVPVKIVFDDSSLSGLALGPGMSVEPKVRVR